MMDRSAPTPPRQRLTLTTVGLLVLPLVALAGVILLFLNTSGGLLLSSPAPIEALTVERTVLKPGSIDLVVRNGGPEPVTIAQAIVNDAIWPFVVSPGPTISRLTTGTVHFDYMWSQGEAYAIRLFTSNAIPFDVEIPVAFTTPEASGRTLLSFTLIGIYVGVIPIFLGLFWFPALRRLGPRAMLFLLALTAGLLIFLGLDTLAEALEQVGQVPGPLQGVGLVGIGSVATFGLLEVISRRQTGADRHESTQRLSLAYMIALGIGLHNLGEGLAIGAAYNVGQISLGAFLVVGFIVQNITEGLGIIAPILHDNPGMKRLALMGMLGGAPAIAGAWLGGLAPTPSLAVFFLAVGVGAIFQVALEIMRLIGKRTAQQPLPMTVYWGVLSGMLILWVTGLMIK